MNERTLRALVSLVLMVAVVVVLLRDEPGGDSPAPPDGDGTATAIEHGRQPDPGAPDVGATAAPVHEPAPPATAFVASVEHVHDGDTVWLVLEPGAQAERTRLLRIDAPEVTREDQPGECGAEAARTRLTQLLPQSAEVTVAHDVERHDQYGRPLVHVWTADGTWVNGQLLAEGHARLVTFRPNTAHTAEAEALQAAAQRDGRGIWRC